MRHCIVDDTFLTQWQCSRKDKGESTLTPRSRILTTEFRVCIVQKYKKLNISGFCVWNVWRGHLEIFNDISWHSASITEPAYVTRYNASIARDRNYSKIYLLQTCVALYLGQSKLHTNHFINHVPIKIGAINISSAYLYMVCSTFLNVRKFLVI